MYSLLLIDDEPWALRGLQGSCNWEKYGFCQVDSTSNSQEALNLLQERTPNLVISDIRMPDLTGIELLKFSKSKNLGCEFVFVSGFSEFEYAQDAVNNGAYAYLLKPIDVEALENVVQGVCQKFEEKGQRSADKPYEQDLLTSGYLNQNFIDLLDYVNGHFSENLTLPFLSSKYHLNQTYISDLFRKATGKPFSKYLTELRINHACTLLKVSHLPIQEVARRAGYREYCNFVRAFKQVMNITPAKYRNGD